MADTDGTLDHRAELMRKWSADKALMAQAGLHAFSEPLESTFLAGKTPADLMQKRGEAKLKRSAASTAVPVVNTHSDKPKNNKKNKKSGKAALAMIKHLFSETMHNEKQKQNGHMTSAETVEELDQKISEQLIKYKETLQNSHQDIQAILNMFPRSQDTKAFVVFTSHATKAIASITKFSSSSDFDKAYLEIANGLLKYVNSVSVMKRLKHKYYYPTFGHWPNQSQLLQKGFFVHHFLSICLEFCRKNINEDTVKPHKESIHDLIHVILKYRQNIDKIYSKMTLLKDALEFKARMQRAENSKVNHRHLTNLGADIEDAFQHDMTIRMGQPFENY
jgi:hypothetical protein